MLFLTLFQFLARLLTSKHLKLFSKYLVGRNGTMWKRCFSAPQNAKKENHVKQKTKCVTDFLLTVRSSSMKDYFQLLKMRKNKSVETKSKCLTYFLLRVKSSRMKDYTFHYVVKTKKTNVYINFNKNNENLEIFCLQVNGYLNTRKSFPIWMFVLMASRKFVLHMHFTFIQEFQPPHIRKNLIFFFFCILNVVMYNNQFSALDNVKMTCQTHKY